MSKYLALLIAVLAHSCSRQNEATQITTLEKYSFDEVIEPHLADASAWPEFGIERANEMIELFDMVELGGAIGQRAQRRVNRLGNDEIQHALLLIVETDKQNTALRRSAYSLLANRDWQSSNRFIPRLTLRLKYEKDWPSNIIIARALANVGSLAGIDAVKSILLNSGEKDIDDLDLAKSLAAEFISEINSDHDSFEDNWQHLLLLSGEWNNAHTYQGVKTDFNQQYQDELWRLVAQFRSQPLRPVDDARFVFIRLEQQAMTVLAAAASDSNRYVRDHCLQTLTWMPASSQRAYDFALEGSLEVLENDFYSSVRAIEYRGSLMDKIQADFLWPFIENGNYEQRTAAADALLRCSDYSGARIDALLIDKSFSPEAQCSLLLLRDELRGSEIVIPRIIGLDQNELTRRLRWQQQRQALATD
jgi:hypothetical protein